MESVLLAHWVVAEHKVPKALKGLRDQRVHWDQEVHKDQRDLLAVEVLLGR